MRTIDITLRSGIDYKAAERAAREAAGEKMTLVAWYDKLRRMEGPREACAREGWKCARVYADNHGADVGVLVNKDQYEFYFTKVPDSFAELDEEEVVEVHKNARRDEFDDVQGG
jgi:hypothetical protein